MAPDQLETASAAAATALPEIRLYHLGCQGVSRLATLQLCSPVPVEAPHADAAVDGLLEDEDAPVEQGFYLAVLEGDALVAVGRLSSLDGRQFGARASSCEKSLVADAQGATTVAGDLDGSDEETSDRGIFADWVDSSDEETSEEGQAEVEEPKGDSTWMEEKESVECSADLSSEEEEKEEQEEEDETSEEEEQKGEDSSDGDEEDSSDKRKSWGQVFLFAKGEDGSHEETSEEEQEWDNTSMEEESNEESSADLSLEEEEQDGEQTTHHDEIGSDKSSAEEHDSKFLQLRICPGKSHVTLAFFTGCCWNMTKSYSIKWLSSKKVEVLDIIKEDISKATASSSPLILQGELNHWLKGCIVMLQFGGPLFYPDKLEEAVQTEVNPTTDDFKIIKMLGKGSAGKVYHCVYKDSLITVSYALKIVEIKKSDDIDAYLHKEPREVNTMSYLSDPKIVKFYKAWKLNECYESNVDRDADSDSDREYDGCNSDSDSSDPLYIAIQLEYCLRTVEDLFPIGRCQVDVEESWALFKKITQALALIHEKGLIHRDIKPSNILLGVDGEIKIGDFGHACWAEWYKNGRSGTPNRGTKAYLAPEIERSPSEKVDIYSLGIIFLEIFTIFRTALERHVVIYNLKDGNYPTEFLGDVVLLKDLTASSAVYRPSTADIMEHIDKRQ